MKSVLHTPHTGLRKGFLLHFMKIEIHAGFQKLRKEEKLHEFRQN